MNIPVLPPDINLSSADFVGTAPAIRFGLAAIKNVGRAAVEVILRVREEGGKKTWARMVSSRPSPAFRRSEQRSRPSFTRIGIAEPNIAFATGVSPALTRPSHFASPKNIFALIFRGLARPARIDVPKSV